MSMGAKTLLHVATMQPDRIAAMVLVSATPYFPQPLRTAAAQFTREAFERLSDADRNMLRSRHVHGDEQILQLYDMTRSFAINYDDMAFTPTLLGTITARTLIVHGDRDPLYPVEMAIELFRGIPQSALWILPNGAHGPVFGFDGAGVYCRRAGASRRRHVDFSLDRVLAGVAAFERANAALLRAGNEFKKFPRRRAEIHGFGFLQCL